MTTPAIAATHFYRYSSAVHLDWLEAILLTHTLYFPTITELNDPVEGRPRIVNSPDRALVRFLLWGWRRSHPHATLHDIARQSALTAMGLKVHGTERAYRDLTELTHGQMKDARVFSMSRRWDNMNLWAKYADGHKGYCLEFANSGLFSVARVVEYRDEIWLDLTEPAAAHALFYWQKRNEWSNEEEVRIVAPRTMAASVPFEAQLLTRVILGKEMAAAHRTQIRQWAAIREPQVTVAQAEYDPMLQRLRVIP